MAFSGLVMLLMVAMGFAFNVYMADVIIRLRQDVQVIRKRLGVEDKKAKATVKNKTDKTSLTEDSKQTDEEKEEENEDAVTDKHIDGKESVNVKQAQARTQQETGIEEDASSDDDE
jgi:predicted Holliday junction resolvase-like endonuclease